VPLTVRFVDLAARHARTADSTLAAVREILESGSYIGGSWVARAESIAAKWFGRRHAAGVGSGTDALMLGLQALGVRSGQEVIVPALTFFATAGAVHAIGAKARIVDVQEDGLMDPLAAEQAVGSNTAAVIPVHLYGNIARRPNVDVPVLDDAAQAIGGTPPRAIGDLTVVSAYPTKTWGAAGNAGFVLGNSADVVNVVRRLSTHGYHDGQHHLYAGHVGRNARIDAIQAAILVTRSTEIAAQVARRRQIAAHYDSSLPSTVRRFPRDEGSPVQQYMIRSPRRDALASGLAKRGIETRIYYPRSIAKEPALASTVPTPVADRLCEELLALPVHADLTDHDVESVVAALRGL
jgi:dTDP-4-amino-4,6-dideoxygalactose transaminase